MDEVVIPAAEELGIVVVLDGTTEEVVLDDLEGEITLDGSEGVDS